MKIEEIKKEIQSIKLTEEEKSGMLDKVFNSPKSSPIVSPYTSMKILWKTHHKVFVYALGFVLVFTVSSGSASVFALKSIPGDKLYSVKVGVTEPFMDIFTFNSYSQAKLEADKAIRRLNEAEKLATQENLTEVHRLEIENRFSKSVDNFETVMNSAKNKKISADKKAELQSYFEKSAASHADNLKQINETKIKDAKQKEQAVQLENAIRSRIQNQSAGSVKGASTSNSSKGNSPSDSKGNSSSKR